MATRALQQVVCYLAWNTSSNAYQTGDSANHTTKWVKDGTEATTTNSNSEVDATNFKGLYKVTMTSTETDCIEGVLGGVSSTANVVLIPTMVAFDYLNTSAPATAGIPDVNAKNINNVSTASVTTINANQGTTQPVNFTGTAGSALVKGDAIDINSVAASSVTTISANIGTTQPVNFTGTAASALVKSDMTDIAGSAVSTSSAQIGVNLVNIAGSAVSTSSAQLGVNVVNVAGSAINALVGGKVDAVNSVRTGTAQAGGATSITLDSGASATNNFYNGLYVQILSATGAGQTRLIVSYTGSTKVANVDHAWATNPDVTSVFVLYPQGDVDVRAWGGNTVSVNVAGIPEVDVVDWNGTAVHTPGTAGIPDVNLINIANSAVSTSTAQLGVNTVNIAGQAAALDANNLLKVDVEDVNGSSVVETGITVRQSLQYMSSALAGVLAGAATTSVTTQAINNSGTTRITATVDANGNRSAITLS